ncbi:MAG TPA: hypothetical protein VH309_02315 [Elusimicrobiota bacterium]|jgi:hypothetical protein|nr:hypothetical protein [Elusimicrobiota bacterium]
MPLSDALVQERGAAAGPAADEGPLAQAEADIKALDDKITAARDAANGKIKPLEDQKKTTRAGYETQRKAIRGRYAQKTKQSEQDARAKK